MEIPKVHLNKSGFVEKIEIPDGTMTQRKYGIQPDVMILQPYEDKEYEVYDHTGKKLRLCRLVSVLPFQIKYDVLEKFETNGE